MRRASGAIPRPLVGEAEAERVAACGDILPARLAPVFGYEFRLGSDSRVDSAFAISDARAALSHFDSLVAERSGFTSPEVITIWRRVGALLGAWCDPRSIVSRGLRVLMIEFDDSWPTGSPPPLPAPLVFWHATKEWPPSSMEHLLMLEEMLRLLTGGPPESRTRDIVARIFREGYGSASGVEPIFGVALSRVPCALRVQVAGVKPREILNVARSTRWPGSLASLEELLAGAAQRTGEDLVAAFDVTDLVLPRIGIEFVRSGPAQRLAPALEFLRSLDLVTPRKARALEDMGDDWQAWGSGDSEVLGRRMSHYKLLFVGDRAVEAKGYLKFMYGGVTDGPEAGVPPPGAGPR
jgi:hypothetical protein